VADRFTALYGDDVMRHRGNLDLWTVSERALRRAGCDEVERLDLCTRCNPELFFRSVERQASRNARRDRSCHLSGFGKTTRASRKRSAQRHDRRGDEVLPMDELQVLADAGVEVVGENRAAGPSNRSTRATATRSRWHFIGHLQSRKAKAVSDLCELCHSLASESAARKLTIPRSSR